MDEENDEGGRGLTREQGMDRSEGTANSEDQEVAGFKRVQKNGGRRDGGGEKRNMENQIGER